MELSSAPASARSGYNILASRPGGAPSVPPIRVQTAISPGYFASAASPQSSSSVIDKPPSRRATRLRSTLQKSVFTSTEEGMLRERRSGVVRIAASDPASRRLARKIKIFARKLALRANQSESDMIDSRMLTQESLADFETPNTTNETRTEQFESLVGVFKERAFAAVHSCLSNLEAPENQTTNNRETMGKSLKQWLYDVQIADNLAQMCSFYLVNPKYMNTAKWPRKEILMQWQNSNHEAMAFFLAADTL